MYVLVGLFLGLQLTKISSSLISFFCLLNILFSLYFVIYLNLDIYGVALGTLLSAYLSAILFIFYTYFFFKRKFNIKLTFKGVFVKKKIIRLFNINFDIFIRTILITFSFLWFTYQSSKLGEDYLAVNTILMQFIMMSSFFLDSYAFSTEGVVGFSIGRKVKKSFLLIVENSIKLSFISSLFISLIYLIFFKNLIGYITDLDYIKFLTFNYIVWIILMPPVASFCYQLDGIFIGASQTVEMRNSMIISAVIFVFISIYLLKNFGNHGLWLSLMIFMILRSLSLRLYFSNILKKF